MVEIFVAIAIAATMLGAGLLTRHFDLVSLATGGSVLIVVGLLVGLPAGAGYHWYLYRALVAEGRLIKRWWLHPTGLHPGAGSPWRKAVLLWFGAGVAGVLIIFAGCGLLVLGLVRAAG